MKTTQKKIIGKFIKKLKGCTPSLSQNMYFTGTNSTMIPLSEAVTMGVSTRQTPTLWQYPSK